MLWFRFIFYFSSFYSESSNSSIQLCHSLFISDRYKAFHDDNFTDSSTAAKWREHDAGRLLYIYNSCVFGINASFQNL